MITLKKNAADFKILNLTDVHWSNIKTPEGRNIVMSTIRELIERLHPDQLTLSGDQGFAGRLEPYEELAGYLDTFGIPWAPIWGNHDNQNGPEEVNRIADAYMAHPLCLFEKGDPALGNGNYVIAIEEEGRVVAGLIMMDSHDHQMYTMEDGSEKWGGSCLLLEQLAWYRAHIDVLNKMGCRNTAMILHIPIYGYRTAMRAAVKLEVDVNAEEARQGKAWREKYADTVGVCLNGVNSGHRDDHVLQTVLDMNSTKYILCGHDHFNNTIIPYRGITMVYSLKTGMCAGGNPNMNGGTLLTVNDTGFCDVHHEFVAVPPR